MTSKAIADAFGEMEYFNTFGGSPAAMAAGSAVMDVVEAERLQQNAALVGTHLLARLRVCPHTHARTHPFGDMITD